MFVAALCARPLHRSPQPFASLPAASQPTYMKLQGQQTRRVSRHAKRSDAESAGNHRHCAVVYIICFCRCVAVRATWSFELQPLCGSGGWCVQGLLQTLRGSSSHLAPRRRSRCSSSLCSSLPVDADIVGGGFPTCAYSMQDLRGGC